MSSHHLTTSPRLGWVGLSLGAGLWLAAAPAAQGHDLFAAYIQHRVLITVGAKHVDVTVQLTFFEESSEHERENADTNGDGRLSRAETDAYVQGLEADLAKSVGLRIGGHPVTLTALRATELDLLRQDRVGPGHHRLTLWFFGLTPTDVAKGTECVVEDRLWPTLRALGAVQAKGTDGCRLEALPAADPVYPPAKNNEARSFRARVVSPPDRPPSHE